jgi:hypothetical protein
MTITSSTFFPLLMIAFVAFAASCIMTFQRRKIPGAPLPTSLATTIYLTRYATALEYYGMKRREITSHVNTVRGDLAALPTSEIRQALARFGAPRTLAAEVALGTLRPSVLRGSLWFGIATFASVVVTLLTTDAFLSGFESVAQPGQNAEWSTIGFFTSATMGTEGNALTVEFGGVALFLAPLLAFVIGARLWRLARRNA